MRTPPPLSEAPRFPVVAGLAALAAGVTVASMLKVNVSALYETPAIRRGEVWRLLTSILPHANALHLIFNLYWLWVFGSLVEESFGHWKTFALVVFLALGSGSAEYAFLDGGIGLSGVVYGLFGFLWALSRYSPRFADVVDQNTTVLFVVWFFLCIGLTVSHVMPVANIAHGVGAVLGGLVGLAAGGPRQGRAAAGGGAVVLTAAFVAGAVFARPYIDLSPNRGKDEVHLADTALEANQYDEALRWYLDAVRMRPNDARSWYNLGVTYDRLRQQEKAAAAFEKAWQLQPDDPQIKEVHEARQRNGPAGGG